MQTEVRKIVQKSVEYQVILCEKSVSLKKVFESFVSGQNC